MTQWTDQKDSWTSSGWKGGERAGDQKWGSSWEDKRGGEQSTPAWESTDPKWSRTFSFPVVDWESVLPSLPVFEKDFYVPHPDVEARTDAEVEAILTENQIQVIPTAHYGDNTADCDKRPTPRPVTNLIEASFPEYITAKLCAQLGGPFTQPTAVQKLLWPVALSGRDCLAIAPTGTGKTLGYLLPAIVHISAQTPPSPSDQSPIVLIVAPTRELAAQIMEQAVLYGSAITEVGAKALSPVCVFGGVRKIDQKLELEDKCPDLIVATPGRLMDFLDDGTLSLRRVTYFVVDEVDRLISLDGKAGLEHNGFVQDMEKISALVRPDRQCVMCSATCTVDVMTLARSLCGNEPVIFQVAAAGQSEKLLVSATVEQTFISVGDSEYDKLEFLASSILPDTFTDRLSRCEQKVMIFANSKTRVDWLTESLRTAGWPAIGVHADKVQEEREWIFTNFKNGTTNILVATDVMGRGMDFEDVRCVVNFDLPMSIEAYIHRVGRTGRCGKKTKKGYALSFVTGREWDILPGLEKMFIHSELEIPSVLAERIADYRKWDASRGNY